VIEQTTMLLQREDTAVGIAENDHTRGSNCDVMHMADTLSYFPEIAAKIVVTSFEGKFDF